MTQYSSLITHYSPSAWAALVALAGLTACAAAGEHHHEHKPPHGGAPIVFGDGLAHLELVLDAKEGKLTAYVLDAELQRAVRVKQKEIELRVRPGDGKSEAVVKLRAVGSVLTGESEGDTSQFEGQDAGLKGLARFAGTIAALTVRGKEFKDVEFRFPEGNEAAR